MIYVVSITQDQQGSLITRAKSFAGSGRNKATVRKAEIGLRRRLRSSFKQMAKALAQKVLAKYADVYRADDLPVLPDSIIGEIASLLDQKAFDEIVKLAQPYHVGVATGGASGTSKAIEALGFDAHASVATANAKVWGQHRAAEMVGRKWVDGKLVTNPNAKWAINESTRDMIRAEVERAVKNGSTVTELADAIRSSSAFSEQRALMVARTEMAMADIQGTMAGYRACPFIKGKRWVTAGDDAVSEECQACEAEGNIGIDEAFSSGEDAPPNHPNCRCSISPVFEDEMQ